MSSTAAVEVNRSRSKGIPPWLVFSLLTVLVWGIWGALTKAISAGIDAYTNQILFAIGVLPVMAIVGTCGRSSRRAASRRGIFYAFLTGVLGGTGNIAFFEALAKGGKASVVVPATALSPVVTVVCGYLLLKERATAHQKVGLLLAMVAIYLVSL